MFQYIKNINSDFKEILININNNIMRLTEEVEKFAPTYLNEA